MTRFGPLYVSLEHLQWVTWCKSPWRILIFFKKYQMQPITQDQWQIAKLILEFKSAHPKCVNFDGVRFVSTLFCIYFDSSTMCLERNLRGSLFIGSFGALRTSFSWRILPSPRWNKAYREAQDNLGTIHNLCFFWIGKKISRRDEILKCLSTFELNILSKNI